MAGYRAQRTRVVTAPWNVEEGIEPFRATIVCSLSFDQIGMIKVGSGASYNDLFESIAPYVLDWNAEAFNVETKQWEPIDAPAVGGANVLSAVDPSIAYFLAAKLREVYLGGDDRPKGLTPSVDTPDGKPDSSSDSPPPASARKNRKATN